jgi:hypothetical protein
MTDELNSFLEVEDGLAPPDPIVDAGGAGDGGQPPSSDAPVVPEPKPDPAKVEDPPDEVPEDVRGFKMALAAAHAKRNDHKGRADRAEGELTATKAELETLRKASIAPAAVPVVPVAPAAAIPPVYPPIAAKPFVVPNPAEDPNGYHLHIERKIFNNLLNTSEAMLRDSIKDNADVDKHMAIYKKAEDANPALRNELTRQAHPYRWAYEQAKRISAMEEIGSDPAAFRAKIEAETRAAILAESVPDPVVGATPPSLPRSLANTSSAAPRMAAMEVAPEFDDIFTPRKRRS